VRPYRSWACVTARGGRSAGPRAQASTVAGLIDRAPRRAPSLACVSSDEELTIDFRLLLHCNRSLCVVLCNESIPVCGCVISMGSEGTRASVTRYLPLPVALGKLVSTCVLIRFAFAVNRRAGTYSRLPLLTGGACTFNEGTFRLSITRPVGSSLRSVRRSRRAFVRTTTARNCHGRALRHPKDVECELTRCGVGRIVGGDVGSWL
jgi:hypothetical protein